MLMGNTAASIAASSAAPVHLQLRWLILVCDIRAWPSLHESNQLDLLCLLHKYIISAFSLVLLRPEPTSIKSIFIVLLCLYVYGVISICKHPALVISIHNGGRRGVED